VRRIALLIMVAVVVLSGPALWAGTSGAGRDVGNLTRGLPVLIAVSAFDVSSPSTSSLFASTFATAGPSLRGLAHRISPYIFIPRYASRSSRHVSSLGVIPLAAVS
jgi:hypothetical protein